MATLMGQDKNKTLEQQPKANSPKNFFKSYTKKLQETQNKPSTDYGNPNLRSTEFKNTAEDIINTTPRRNLHKRVDYGEDD